MKFKKKPVVIEAVQFINSADIHEFCGDKVREPVGKNYLEIETKEGIMQAQKGDWIIKGVKGEFYPCKPDIFDLTYELAFEVSVSELPLHTHPDKEKAAVEAGIIDDHVIVDRKDWEAIHQMLDDYLAGTGIHMIACERHEQIKKHGFNVPYDIQHNHNYQLIIGVIHLLSKNSCDEGTCPDGWDNQLWLKMKSKSLSERLIIAGALCAAEYDRLQELLNKKDLEEKEK